MKNATQATPRDYAGLKIKRVGTSQVREGTKRAALTTAVMAARTTDKAYATPVKWGRSTIYPASQDIRFAVNAGLIELH